MHLTKERQVMLEPLAASRTKFRFSLPLFGIDFQFGVNIRTRLNLSVGSLVEWVDRLQKCLAA
jgi:hypothetical protein